MIKRHRQTKIVATLGPASSSEEMLEKLVKTGVDVFRLNFSHGKTEEKRELVKRIRKIEAKLGHPIGIMADLQGPKLRIGTFKNDRIELSEGMTIRFDLDETPGDESRVYLPHPEIISALIPDSHILLDDGKVRVRIIEKGGEFLVGTVVEGRKLSNNKGFNVPDVILPIPALTDKDRKDLIAALDMEVDWVAQSFVQKPDDVAEARKLINGRAGLLVKLEKPSAIDYLDQIIDLADGAMVARGDLGVEMPPEEVPAIQKRIVRTLRAAGKPVIVATQMLESMIEDPRPTRAEASDVATAIYDGADAVMLSAETAVGAYPSNAVEIMDRIAQSTETDPLYRQMMDANLPDDDASATDAISLGAYQIAKKIKAAAIVNYTTTGSTALKTAQKRPPMPILCLTQNPSVTRRLTMSYGVHAVYMGQVQELEELVKTACKVAKDHELAEQRQRLVITVGLPFGTPGSTNVIRVAWSE